MNKLSKTTLVKVGGWVITAMAAVAVAWAGDKETKKQIDETVRDILDKKSEEEAN